MDLVACNAPSLVSVIAITNSDAFEIVERAGAGMLKAGETPLLLLRPRAGAAAEASRRATNVTEEARQTVTLVHAGGLHARPAARAREAARGLDARVEVRYEGRKAPIESVVGLLGLGAGEGSTVEILGVGAQAAAAVEAVAHELLREAHGEAEEKPARQSSPAPRTVAQTGGAPLAPNTLVGVCAAPGVAVGKLVRWDDADLDPPEVASGTSAAESRLLDKALATVDAELNSTVRDASQRGAHGEAGIFAVHRVLLEDPTLLDAARDLISLGKSAGFAWRESIRAQIAVLTKIDDALLAERAADLRDLEKRVLRALGYSNNAARTLPDEAVLVAEEFTPSDLSTLDRTRVTALVMARGGATSHAAILARQSGIPALVAVGDALHAIPEGTQVVVDATAGRIEFAPSALDVERARVERSRLAGVREANRRTSQQAATTADGHAVEVAANIATLEDAKTAVENGADAVGLLRTELLFIHRATAPTIDEHRQSYQSIVDALAGRTAIIRTLDVGADKEVDYLTLPPEPNPALGPRRSVRATAPGPARRPVARPAGGATARRRAHPVADGDRRRRADPSAQAHRRIRPRAGRTDPIEVGVMIEVPLMAAEVNSPISSRRTPTSCRSAFNDLTQYTLFAGSLSCSSSRSKLDGLHPAVLRLISQTVAGAARHHKWVGVCGELASDPDAIPVLVGLGITELSVTPSAVPGQGACAASIISCASNAAQDVLALESAQAVRAVESVAKPGRWTKPRMVHGGISLNNHVKQRLDEETK